MEKDEQRTVVRKKDKALLAALAVFALVMASIAVVGILLIHPAEATIQGQADCDAVRVSGKLPGRIVRFYVHEGDTVHKGDKLVSIYSSTVDAKYYQAKQMQDVAASQNQKAERGTREELKQGAYNVWQQAIAAQTIAEKTYQRVENLYQQGVATQQKRDEAKAAYDAATAQVKAAKAQYDMAVKGAQQEDKNAARSMANAARGTVMEVESLLEGNVNLADAVCHTQNLLLIWVDGQRVDADHGTQVEEAYTAGHLLVERCDLADGRHVEHILQHGLVESHAGHGVMSAGDTQLTHLCIILHHTQPVGSRRRQIVGNDDRVLIAFREEVR
jgi:multidrug efflux pump subunit AcrA (membrane-fusion protein)